LIATFCEYFPKYAWENKKFQIIYIFESGISIVIENFITSSKHYRTKISYDKDITQYINKHKKHYKKHKEELANKDDYPYAADFYSFKFQQLRYRSDYFTEEFFKKSTFISSSRSFFSSLEMNVFSFLANNISIDPFIKEFGQSFEQVKNIHSRGINRSIVLRRNKNFSQQHSIIVDKINQILGGNYVNKDGIDWIINSKKRVKLIHASSGQQESLPMLLILLYLPFIGGQGQSFFIEEPEAHLFPSAQKEIVNILSRIYNTTNSSYFITTHSPYILSSINNLVTLSEALDKNNTDAKAIKEITKLLPVENKVNFKDISAYSIENGRASSITDDQNHLVGVSVIDSVSDTFEEEFDSLLNFL